jgi:hypothetical protein
MPKHQEAGLNSFGDGRYINTSQALTAEKTTAQNAQHLCVGEQANGIFLAWCKKHQRRLKTGSNNCVPQPSKVACSFSHKPLSFAAV